MKVWNHEAFGDIRLEKKKLLIEIGDIDALEMEGQAPYDLIRKRERLLHKLEEILLKEKRSTAKKMKAKWAKEGVCVCEL